MPDIGFGEIITIVVIALLVFGPDRLPKVAADAGRMLRQVRQMAANARADLVDAAGLEDDPELSQTVRDLRDLDPRRGLSGILGGEPAGPRPPAGAGGTGARTDPARSSAPATPAPSDAAGPTGAGGQSAGKPAGPASPAAAPSSIARNPAPATPGTSPGAPVADPVVEPVPAVDPDWT